MRGPLVLCAVAGLLWAAPATAQSLVLRPEVALEARLFPQDPLEPGQVRSLQGGVILTGEAIWTSADRNLRIRLEPYLRLDTADAERRYADLREASIGLGRDGWAALAGFSQVFWGVVESRNVVDVINQFDTVEDIDEGEKLGQPMLRLSRRGGFGLLEAYYLPYFRERLYPGADGRLRTIPAIDTKAGRVDRGGGDWAGDVALRYAQRFDGFDIGLHAFHGTGRAPLLVFNPGSGKLDPIYLELTQAGVDVQYTTGPWLLKLETITARTGGDGFIAAAGGFEYTLYDVGGSGLDVGLIAEYLHDGRDGGRTPAILFQDDVFAGTRLTLNDVQDTELLLGAIVDVATGGMQASLEFQRRIGDRMLLELEMRAFTASGDPLLTAVRRDDAVTLRLTRFL